MHGLRDRVGQSGRSREVDRDDELERRLECGLHAERSAGADQFEILASYGSGAVGSDAARCSGGDLGNHRFVGIKWTEGASESSTIYKPLLKHQSSLQTG